MVEPRSPLYTSFLCGWRRGPRWEQKGDFLSDPRVSLLLGDKLTIRGRPQRAAQLSSPVFSLR